MTDQPVHVDTQVTRAVAALLEGVTGPDGAVVPVIRSRQYPDTAKLAAIAVFMPTATGAQQTHGTPGSRIQRRSQRVQVNVILTRATGVEDTLEDDLVAVCLQVENRMSAGFALTNPTGVRIALKASFLRRDIGLIPGGKVTKLVGANAFMFTTDHREGQAQTALTQTND